MSANVETDASACREARSLDQDATHVLLVLNRKAGRGRWRHVTNQAVAAIQQRGLQVLQTSDLGKLAEKADALARDGRLRAVVAAGGDGTISAALNATPIGTPLAVLPLGTENLLAGYLDHGCRPDRLADLLTRGLVAPLDAAKANDRLFALVFSAGLDAEVVRHVHEQRRGNITHLAYGWPLLTAVRKYRYPKIRASWKDQTGELQVAEGCWSFVVNLPRYALKLPLAPAAVGTDGQLDLCLMERGSLTSGLRYLWHMIRKQHNRLPEVRAVTSTKFRIEPADDVPVPYQIDGDPGGWLPVEVSVVPERMHVVVLPEVAERLGLSFPVARD